MVLSTWKFLRLVLTMLPVAAVLTTTIGCSSEGGQPVSGKVFVDDKPLTMGGVTFVPDKEKGNTSTESPYGQITEAGTYELYTNNKKGAPAGWYKVVVVAQEKPDSTKPNENKSLVNAKYNKADTTDLKVEVKPGGAYELKLSGPSGATPSTPGNPMPMPK